MISWQPISYSSKYGKNGQPEFDGLFYKNNKHGIGVEFDQLGRKAFQKEFKNGKSKGDWIEFLPDSNKVICRNEDRIKFYEGEIADGMINGLGIQYDKLGYKKTEGNFKNGYLNGQGIQYENGLKKYQGEFKDGIANAS